MAKDYYQLLGVPRSADEKEIKSAYRKLARKFHPDVNPGDKSAESKFKEISEAHSVLSDPEKRKLYDQFGSNWENPGFAGAGGGGVGGHVNFDMGGEGFGSLFEQIFAGFGGAGSGGAGRVRFQDMETNQPRDVERVVEMSLEEIDKGTTRVLTYQTMDGVGCATKFPPSPETRRSRSRSQPASRMARNCESPERAQRGRTAVQATSTW